MDITELQGKFIIGYFESVEPVVRNDGTTVDGMFRIKLLCQHGTRSYPFDAAYFDNETGVETPIARQMAANPPKKNDLVAVQIISKAAEYKGRLFSNDTAAGIRIVEHAA